MYKVKVFERLDTFSYNSNLVWINKFKKIFPCLYNPVVLDW